MFKEEKLFSCGACVVTEIHSVNGADPRHHTWFAGRVNIVLKTAGWYSNEVERE